MTYDPPINVVRVVDLFCGAGGVAAALQEIESEIPGVEFHVIGIDIEDHSNTYPGDVFIRADASRPPLPDGYADLVWASPPCTAYSKMSAAAYGSRKAARAQNPTIPELDVHHVVNTLTRDDGHYIIENVPGAEEHLRDPIALDGGAFRADYQMRRLFETSFDAPRMTHDRDSVPAPLTARTTRRCAAKLKDAKGLPEEWPVDRQIIRSAIPREYVQYLLHYCPGIAVPGVDLPRAVGPEQSQLKQWADPLGLPR